MSRAHSADTYKSYPHILYRGSLLYPGNCWRPLGWADKVKGSCGTQVINIMPGTVPVRTSLTISGYRTVDHLMNLNQSPV